MIHQKSSLELLPKVTESQEADTATTKSEAGSRGLDNCENVILTHLLHLPVGDWQSCYCIGKLRGKV